MKLVIAFAGAFALAAPIAAHAANAANPYGNVDRRVDAGNNTGDAQVDRLNQAQLDSNGVPAPSYGGPTYGGGAPVYVPPPVPAYPTYPAYPAAPQPRGY